MIDKLIINKIQSINGGDLNAEEEETKLSKIAEKDGHDEDSFVRIESLAANSRAI